MVDGLARELARKSMIDVAVMRFIGANNKHNIAQRRAGGQLPIAFRNRRGRNVRRAAFVDFLEVQRITEYRLFLKIANDPVCSARRDQIQQKKSCVENPLREEDDQALKSRWLCDLDERHQMHPLILGLFQQRANPAVVVYHAAQASEVCDRCANHAGNGGHRFENDCPVAVALGKEHVGADA